MSDLISRQNALDALKEYEDVESDNFTKTDPISMMTVATIANCIEVIWKLPSAEPERTAKVRDKKDDPMVDEWHQGRCMNCGKQVRRRNNYCSRCGSRLDWGE